MSLSGLSGGATSWSGHRFIYYESGYDRYKVCIRLVGHPETSRRFCADDLDGAVRWRDARLRGMGVYERLARGD